MNFKTLLNFRYLYYIAIFFLLVNALVFIVAGAVECVRGYIEFTTTGFENTGTSRPGSQLLEGLDLFVSSVVFMIFALGLGQLFLFREDQINHLPKRLRVNSLLELKILLWETILVALIIFCVTHLIRSDLGSWEILPFPILILILSVGLFFVKFKSEETKRINQVAENH